MNPRIVAISGPLKGSIFAIDESDLVIGRSVSCHVRLDDPSVSLRHCTISCEEDCSFLWDRQSAGGTFANGFCFPAKFLLHADRIRVGRSIFVYLDRDDEEVDPAMLILTPAEEEWDRTADSRDRTAAYEAAKATV